MNRYIIHGLAADLREGKQIGLMAYRRDLAKLVFLTLVAELSSECSRVCRATGMESVEHPSGGRLLVISKSGHSLRRTSPLDVVVALDWHAFTVENHVAILDNLKISSATGRHTELIRN